jgi:peptidoglycan/LPS O-acetylase OafA/YrhL
LAGTFSLNSNLTVPKIFRQKNIQSLDGLRAIAITLVILWHITFGLNCPSFIYTMGKYLELGNSGIQLFFVVSGFLITGLLLKEKAETGSIHLKRFYLKRLLKICPVYFAYILVIAILKVIGIAQIGGKDFLGPILFVSDFLGSSWLLAHTWTLSVEVQFYLILPLIFIFLPRNYIFLIAVILLYDLFYFFVRLNPALFVFRGLFLALPPVIFGSMLSLALYKNWLKKIHSVLMHPLFAFSLILSLIIFFPRLYHPARFLRIPYDYIVSSLLMTAFLYYAVHCNTRNLVYRILNNRLIVYIGLMSYGIYIWQQLFFAPEPVFTAYPAWTAFPLNVILALATALLSYNFIEKPFLRLKAKLK